MTPFNNYYQTRYQFIGVLLPVPGRCARYSEYLAQTLRMNSFTGSQQHVRDLDWNTVTYKTNTGILILRNEDMYTVLFTLIAMYSAT